MFLIFAQNINCGYTLEPPRGGCSNEYPQSMFWSKNKKIGIPLQIPVFLYKQVGFMGVYFHGLSRTCFPDVYCHRKKLEEKIRKKCTVCVAKTKALIICAVTAQLICVFVFA